MWTVQLIVIGFAIFTLITDAVGLEEKGESLSGVEQIGSIGKDRAFFYSSLERSHNPRAALWIGRVLNVEDSTECCEACRNEFPDCQTDLFNFDREVSGSHLPQCKCLEKKFQVQPATRRAGLVTGTCGNDGGTSDVDGDLGDGKAFSLLMDDLYLGDTGVSSSRDVSSRSCCSLCQRSHPETHMFQFYNDVRFCECYKTPSGNPVPTHRREFLAGICGNDFGL